MKKIYKNQTNIPLSFAVWLAHDEYEHKSKDKSISVTTLLKPLKQIVLGRRIKPSETICVDISTNTASALGNAIHDSIERAWTSKRLPQTLAKLGYSDKLIKRVKINPTEIQKGDVPIYTECRAEKELNGWTITGEFDFCSEGKLRDFKSTSVYIYQSDKKEHDYRMQGSIYRWIHSDKITKPTMSIDFILTDWQALLATTRKDYPKQRLQTRDYGLIAVNSIEKWLQDQLQKISELDNKPQSELPDCTREELWASEPKFKYYKKFGQKRASKVFSTRESANLQLIADGSTGFVEEVTMEVKACKYCPALGICKQGLGYIKSGNLKMD